MQRCCASCNGSVRWGCSEMEGLENGFCMLIIAVIFFAWGMLRLDARRRYRDAVTLRGTVTGWDCFRGWKGSMERRYYEISVMTDKGSCLIRTNSRKARKYRKIKDITVLVTEPKGVWETLAQMSRNGSLPQSQWAGMRHYVTETGVLPAECRPTLGQSISLLAISGLFLTLSVLSFAGVLI